MYINNKRISILLETAFRGWSKLIRKMDKKIIIDDDLNILLENRKIIGRFKNFDGFYLFKPSHSYFGEELITISENLERMNKDLWKKKLLEDLEKLKECNDHRYFNFVAFYNFKKKLEGYLN